MITNSVPCRLVISVAYVHRCSFNLLYENVSGVWRVLVQYITTSWQVAAGVTTVSSRALLLTESHRHL